MAKKSDRIEEPMDELPSLTKEDVGAFIQVLTAIVMMGSTRIEIHPARWPLIFKGLILHRAYDINQLRYVNGIEDVDHAVMELEFSTKQGQIGCMLMRRPDGERPDETEKQRYWLDTQGPAYDVPEEPSLVEGAPEKKIWMPS